jgi:hypothetical protein
MNNLNNIFANNNNNNNNNANKNNNVNNNNNTNTNNNNNNNTTNKKPTNNKKSAPAANNKKSAPTPSNSKEKIYEKTLKNVLTCQDYAQLFIVVSTRVKNVNNTIEAVHRAMEMQETCHLLKFFLVSDSPNLRDAAILTEVVAKTFLNHLYELYKDPCCKEIIQKTINAHKSLLKSLTLLVNSM